MNQMWTEILQQPEVLKNCIEKNRDNIKAVVENLKKKDIRHVVIAARGTSGHAGVYAKYLMEIKLGIPVSLASPSVTTLYNKGLSFKDTLLIGISQSGVAADVLEVLRTAKSQGAPTIAITNFEDSPLAQEAEFHLFCATGVERSVAATKTFISQLYLLAHLTAQWANDEEFKKELQEVPSLIQNVIDDSDSIKNIVQRYRFINECFVLGRGVNYSIVLETALKIQETTYVRARAYPISEFYHGPFAVIDDHMPVIVFAPEGPSHKDAIEMINKVKNVGADLLIVSNNNETRRLGNCSISIPQGISDFISPFVNVVVSQMFACNLSVLRGINPDAPRGLKKVTITR